MEPFVSLLSTTFLRMQEVGWGSGENMGNGGSGNQAGRPQLNPSSKAEPFPEVGPSIGKEALK